MNIKNVTLRVKEIRKYRNDSEKAHSLEDSLFVEVLTAIAEGRCKQPRETAAEALKSQNIQFSRWYA